MYSAASANSNMGRLARKTLPFLKSAQNSDKSDKRKRWMFIYFTQTLPKLQASLSPHRYPNSCDPSRFKPRKKIVKPENIGKELEKLEEKFENRKKIVKFEDVDKVLEDLDDEAVGNVKITMIYYLDEAVLVVKTTIEKLITYLESDLKETVEVEVAEQLGTVISRAVERIGLKNLKN